MSDETTPTEPLSDSDTAFLRHARFGELPARVRPEDHVELVETDARRDLPDNVNHPYDDVRG